MGKEAFNWKSLFIADNNEGDEKYKKSTENIKNVENVQSTQFPSSSTQTIAPSIATNSTNTTSGNPFFGEILEVYEKGFDSLNHEGFDFYELFKSVTVVGPNNPQSYQMAFAMGKSLKPDLTKQFLLDKSTVYISEIEKVFKNYDVIGNSKQSELNNDILKRKESLTKEIEDIKIKIEQLQQALVSKSTDLQKIDTDNQQKFIEIQQKIEANSLAKQKILDSINIVINGINQYL